MNSLLLFVYLVTFKVSASNVILNDQLLQPGHCLHLKEGKEHFYKYISNSHQVLRVQELINSEQNQIIIFNDQEGSFDYVDQNDVIQIDCT